VGAHTADRITLWIPLSDATLENGCMTVIPKNLLPPRTPDDFASDMGAIDVEAWRAMLQGSRPLPARAGSVLAWDFQVVHWSSIAGEAEGARVSLSVECLGEGAVPGPSEVPLLDLDEIPPFEERLRAIAQGILSYERFEPTTIRYAPLARRMLDRLDLG
jgi:ectoine hydroxylase-related dioxygenase (phytanoyl-CoA dioxygenase family)